jgi:hypothetical protein
MLLFVATSKLSVARCTHRKEPRESLGIMTYLLFRSSYAELDTSNHERGTYDNQGLVLSIAMLSLLGQESPIEFLHIGMKIVKKMTPLYTYNMCLTALWPATPFPLQQILVIQETQNFDKARENSNNCTCCLCRWDFYILLKEEHRSKIDSLLLQSAVVS